MIRNNDQKWVLREFHVRQSRQLIAIAIALFLVLLSAVLYKRPGVFGDFTKGELYGGQIAAIAAFLIFSIYNWRCPACNKNIGSNINQRRCRKCRTRLQ